MNIPELLSEDHTQKVVVFYGGRFQPMHKGHYKVYKFLADKFGADNIFIATMFGKKQQAMHDEKNYSRDPFTFPEKQHIISTMFNIQADHIVNTMPYRPDIKLIGRDPYTTAVILAFSEKDIGSIGLEFRDKPHRATIIQEIINNQNYKSYPHEQRNLNVGMNLPYNLHTLQLVTMQEKCWYCLLICNVL